EAQHAARVSRVDDAVVPKSCAGVIRMALAFVLLADWGLESVFFFSGPLATARFDAVALDRRQHACRLFAAHYRNARVGPHPQEARAVGAPAHRVIAGAETAANHHGEFRH